MVSPSTSPDEERKRQNWRDYFDRGERYDVPYLPERWNAIVRRNVVRSEERRVGKECSQQCRSRWSPYH